MLALVDEPNSAAAVQRTLVSASVSFSGPLPPPEILAKYNQVLPGSAERIMAMAEEQQRHREHLEKVVIESNAAVQKLGPILGFIVAMSAVIGGVVVILMGRSAAGLVTILASLGSLVGVFIYGKRSQANELAAKKPERT